MHVIRYMRSKIYDFSIFVKKFNKKSIFLPLYPLHQYRTTSQTRFILQLYIYVSQKETSLVACLQSRTMFPKLNTNAKNDFFWHK